MTVLLSNCRIVLLSHCLIAGGVAPWPVFTPTQYTNVTNEQTPHDDTDRAMCIASRSNNHSTTRVADVIIKVQTTLQHTPWSNGGPLAYLAVVP